MLRAYQGLTNKIKARFRLLFRTVKTVNNVATLHARQIYILPTRWSIFYALMLLVLLIGAINYSLSLIYLIAFLLAALVNVALLHTWRNLAHLQLSVTQAQPVFAGELATIHIQVKELKNRDRQAIQAGFFENKKTIFALLGNQTKRIDLSLHTSTRGYHVVPRIRLHTEFPMTLFHAWALVDSPYRVVVYPMPSNNAIEMPHTIDVDAKTGDTTHSGDEDFVGHKTYQIGDLPSKVDWKASSRGIGMFSKQYSSETGSALYLDWMYTSGDTETRISQLTRLVIDAHAAQKKYGLTLNNGMRLAPDNTNSHYHACLKALALL